MMTKYNTVHCFVLKGSIEMLEILGVVRENGNEQQSLPPVVRLCVQS